MTRHRRRVWVAFAAIAIMGIVALFVQRGLRPEAGVVGESPATNPPPAGTVESDSTTASRPSKLALGSSAAHADWRKAIERHREDRNVVALQHLIESRPGDTPSNRAQLLAIGTRELASLGADARGAFDDLLASPYRDVRLSAINAYVSAASGLAPSRSAKRDALSRQLVDQDPVIRAKAEALLAFLAR